MFVIRFRLDFCADCQSLGVSNFCKVVSDYRSRPRILKVKKSRARKEKRHSRRYAFTILHPSHCIGRNDQFKHFRLYPLAK